MLNDLPDMLRTMIFVISAGIGVFALTLMIVLYDMASEAREYFKRENRKAWKEERRL